MFVDPDKSAGTEYALRLGTTSGVSVSVRTSFPGRRKSLAGSHCYLLPAACLKAIDEYLTRQVPFEEAYESGFDDMQRHIPDTTKIEALIDWRPTRTLDG